MGGGVSNSKLWTIFVNADLVDGSKYLAGDAQFRDIFVNYVKGGQWADRLTTMILDEKMKDSKDRLTLPDPDKLWLSYNFAEDMVCDFGESSQKGKLMRSPKISKTSRNILSDSFIIANCVGFSSRQLESIMYCVLYPLFASTPDDDYTPRSSCATRTCDTSCEIEVNRCQRVQDIISTCVEHTSEEEMHDILQSPEWVFDTSDAFDNFPLALSVCNTDKPGCPIVYVNKAFEAMSGYSLVELSGQGLDILHGGATQASQVLLLKEAVATGHAAKVAVTYYTKKQKAFLDLVAVRVCAHYSIAVHFAASPASHPEDLKMVEDLLLLVSCVLQAPLLKAPTHSTTLPNRSLAQARNATGSSVASLTRLLSSSVSTEQQLYNFGGGGGLSLSGKSLPPGADSIHPLVF